MPEYNQGDSFMYRVLNWSKGAGDSTKTRTAASPISGSTGTSQKLVAAIGADGDPNKIPLSNLESGHSALENTAALGDQVSATGINWALVVGVAGLVLTLFWVLRHH